MKKLIFRYGAMNSSKTAQLLMWKYNYEEANFKVEVLKPAIDTRLDFKTNKTGLVSSRTGLSCDCILINSEDSIRNILDIENTDIIMVDEAQFLTEAQVDELYDISFEKTVVCFGLKTDFTQHFFPGSKRLMELADDIQELKTVCKCGKKATINARFDAFGNIITVGEQIDIGGNEKYRALCKNCYEKLKKEAQKRNQ